MMAKALEKNTKEKSKFQFSELTRIPYQSTLENMISNFQMALDQYLSNSYLWTLLYGHILRDSAFLVGFWTVVLEKTLESPLGCKEIQPVHPKGDQCSLEGLMLKLKLQYFGHLMRRIDSLEKTMMLAGEDWRWEKKGTKEDEMVGWHHQLHGHEFE